MAKIEIIGCPKTPNYCAIEAVQKFILDNWTSRNYKDYERVKEFHVTSGRYVKVTEDLSPFQAFSASKDLNCKFNVEVIDNG